ncbi:hypothetical protein DH2020_012333 [Rehmannia glutinosa]|uniref:HTH myb-type domain-containing protein n=1 Tax=Rehmannia glutinosa TaxID=99300 RepID=A0ABR0WZU0_REHGL
MIAVFVAIERLKEEKEKEMGPAMEEFILFRSGGEEDGRAKVSNNFLEKKNWMSSVQLWSTPVQYENNFVTRNQDFVLNFTSSYQEGEGNSIESESQGCNLKNRTGAFVPFKKSSGGTAPVPGLLSLSIPVADQVEYNTDLTEKGNTNSVFGRTKLQQPQQEEQERKQRRCWTADLHRRFVDALHQLGGEQTATPKQIKEVMKVDGLTNDEVKSHLQKYRIHIRKLSSSSAGPSNYPWLALDQFGDFSKPMAANSGSPQGSLRPGKPDKVGSSTGGDKIEDEE